MFEIIKNQNKLLILHFVVHLLNKCDKIIMWFDIFQIDDKSFYEKKTQKFLPFFIKDTLHLRKFRREYKKQNKNKEPYLLST